MTEPDSFSSSINPERVAGFPVVFDEATNLTYMLAIRHSDFVAVWIALSTWGLAKSKWDTWDTVRQDIETWGIAKSKVY